VLFGSASAAHADRLENQWLMQAEPVPAAVTSFDGTVGSGDGSDWYTFGVDGVQQLHVGTTNTNCVSVSLKDDQGNGLPDDYTTPAGQHRYLLQVTYSSCGSSSSGAYTAQITTGGRFDVSEMPVAAGTGEPNENAGTAAGPLVDGQWYSGSIDTQNDEDWFTFYVAPGTHQITLSSIAPPNADNSNTYTWTNISLSSGDVFAGAERGGINSSSTTVVGPTQMWVKASYTSSSSRPLYWFSVSGGGALTPTLQVPPPPPPAPPVPTPTPAVVTPPQAKCKIASSKVKRKKTIKATCVNLRSGTRLEARFYRYTTKTKRGIKGKSVFVTVGKNGRVSVPTKGRKTGLYRVSLWNTGKLTSRQVRVR
jgi:hypothetical protein